MDMELVKLIISPKLLSQTCFLCYKQHEALNNIHSDIVIVKDNQEFIISVFKMVSCLFSIQESILQKVCDKCSNTVISSYILIQHHNLMKQNLMKITGRMANEITSMNKNTVNNKCYLTLNTTDNQTMINENKIPANNNEIVNMEIEKCLKCDMIFESRVHLQEHKNIVHKNTNEAVICHICGKNSRTPSSLKSHMNCHKEKQCPYCSKMLKSHSHYNIHVQNHVKTTRRKRNQTSYNCHNCTFVSLSKGSLEAHINKAHLHLRPHVCPICPKGFFKKSNLTEHINIHNKVKTETCEVCGDHFVSKKTLMEHLRLHKNYKPYKCDICFTSFVTSGRRSDHMKRKHLEKLERCLICNKMFSLKKELTRHVKKTHWQNVPEFVDNVNNCGDADMLLTIT